MARKGNSITDTSTVLKYQATVKQALELDAKNGNTHWRDALAKEMKALSDMKVFNILKPGSKPPEGHQFYPNMDYL